MLFSIPNPALVALARTLAVYPRAHLRQTRSSVRVPPVVKGVGPAVAAPAATRAAADAEADGGNAGERAAMENAAHDVVVALPFIHSFIRSDCTADLVWVMKH